MYGDIKKVANFTLEELTYNYEELKSYPGGIIMANILKSYIMPHPPIMIPEIGKGEEKKIENTINACMAIGEEIANLKPHTIILITPHGPVFRDAVAISKVNKINGSFEKFGVPKLQMEIKINEELTSAIEREARKSHILMAEITENSMNEYGVSCDLDHGGMVPLYFINKHYKNYDLVHITYGILPKIQLYEFGMLIKDVVRNYYNDVVVIASGDLSHKLSDDGPYGYNPLGAVYDKGITSLLSQGDVLNIFNMDNKLIDAAGECGMRSFYIMLGAMDGCKIDGKLLSYEGPFGVGYGVLSFHTAPGENREFLQTLIETKETELKLKREREDVYVKLARESLEHYIIEGKYIDIPNYVTEEMLNNQRGVFVSLKKDGELRGCIGTVSPVTNNCAEEIIRNAVEAGERDPRFFPVDEEELSELVYSVDVLMPAEPASIEDLDVKKYGVIVRSGTRAGLLLPDLEGVDTTNEQLSIALRKAGISPSEDYEIERFEVIRHI